MKDNLARKDAGMKRFEFSIMQEGNDYGSHQGIDFDQQELHETIFAIEMDAS